MLCSCAGDCIINTPVTCMIDDCVRIAISTACGFLFLWLTRINCVLSFIGPSMALMVYCQ